MSEIARKKPDLSLDLPVGVVRTKPNLNGENLRIALVVSRFNSQIASKMTELCVTRLVELGVSAENITITSVPGAVEVPFVASHLINQARHQAIIALGAVIKGETDHYHYVCQQVSDSIAKLNVEYGTPIIFGILTTDNEKQATARLKLATNYAEDAIEMANFARIS